MHKPEQTFRKCLQIGAASHLSGFLYECNRKEACHIKCDLGARKPFCGTPLNEAIRKAKESVKNVA